MKQLKTIKVYEVESVIYEIPESPKEFFKYWIEKLSIVPEEYRDSAKFELDLNSYYDSPTLGLEVTYQRLETEEEELERTTKDINYKESLKQSQLAQFNKLKQELGL